MCTGFTTVELALFSMLCAFHLRSNIGFQLSPHKRVLAIREGLHFREASATAMSRFVSDTTHSYIFIYIYTYVYTQTHKYVPQFI